MIARRLAGLVAAVLLLALAAGLAVLAADVLRWRDHAERADARFAARRGEPTMWDVDTRLPGERVRRLLAVDDDVAFRRALQRFRLANVRVPPADAQDLAVRGQVDTELARAARGQPSAELRSRLSTLRAVLVFEEARFDEGQREEFLRRSLAELRQAITVDPGNADAKYDLELVLSLLAGASEEAATGSGGRRSDVTGSGAGAASTGSGF